MIRSDTFIIPKNNKMPKFARLKTRMRSTCRWIDDGSAEARRRKKDNDTLGNDSIIYLTHLSEASRTGLDLTFVNEKNQDKSECLYSV